MSETLFYEERKRRIHPAVIVGMVLVILGAAAFVGISLFRGGDSNEIVPPSAVTTAGSAESAPPAAPAEPPTETFEVFESKDPFRPLVLPPNLGGTGTTGGTTSGGTTSGGTTTSTGGGAAGGAAPTGGQQVTLLDVFSDGGTNKAQIKVGSTVYTVVVGETFATNFKLVSISGTCTTLLHGDDKFTLCEGEQVFK